MHYDDGHSAWLGRQLMVTNDIADVTSHTDKSNRKRNHTNLNRKGALMFEQTTFEVTEAQTQTPATTPSGFSGEGKGDTTEVETTTSKLVMTPNKEQGDATAAPLYPYDTPIFVDDEETESEGEAALLPNGRPKPSAVRGRCPECGEELVSNLYYIGGQGYLMVWECWASLGENAQCTYRCVL